MPGTYRQDIRGAFPVNNTINAFETVSIDVKIWSIRFKMAGIVLLLMLCGCIRRDVETIVIRGYDTEVNLVLRMAKNNNFIE